MELLARCARVGHASKDKCDPAFIPCTERSLSYPYNYLAQKFKMGAARHHPEQISTASPFVATFPATNLLVFAYSHISFRSAIQAFDLSKLLHPGISQLNTKRPSKMFSQDRKYFPFRFSRVLALLLLLTSPRRVISGPESCGKIAHAFMKNPTAEVVTDTKFLVNLVDCLTSLGYNDVISQKLRDLILKLPDLIEKVLPFGKEKGLVLLSAYLAYRSYELYDRAMKLEANYRKYRHEFEELQEEIKPVLKFIMEQLIPQLKNGDIDSMQNTIEKLLRMLGGFSTKLRELTEAINKDVTQGESNKRWSFGYAAGATTACVGSIFVASPMAVGFTCVPAAVSVASYISLDRDNTLTKLDLLWEDMVKLRKELAKYRTHLQLAKMNHKGKSKCN